MVTSSSEGVRQGRLGPVPRGRRPPDGPDPQAPLVLAAAGKAVDECLAQAYFQQHRLPVVIPHAASTRAVRASRARTAWSSRTWCSARSPNEPILSCLGDGQQSRCFSAVHDVVRRSCSWTARTPRRRSSTSDPTRKSPCSSGAAHQAPVPATATPAFIEFVPLRAGLAARSRTCAGACRTFARSAATWAIARRCRSTVCSN